MDWFLYGNGFCHERVKTVFWNVRAGSVKIIHFAAISSIMYFGDSFNPLTINVSHHLETSQLICNANQLTGFYMIGNNDC